MARSLVELQAAPDADAAALADARTRGETAWPELALADDVWLPYLADRLPADGALADALGALHITDLWLACACLAGEPRAHAAFDRAHRAALEFAARRIAPAGTSAEDVVQLAYAKLFVGDTRPAAIGAYAGRGSIGAWARMSVVRIALDLRRAAGHAELATGDEDIVSWPDPAEDPELAAIRARYGVEFKAAFEQAMAGLTPRERNVLRQQVVFQMTIDQIAAVHRVHRSVAARWLVDARLSLLVATREALAARLGANRAQVESLLTLLHSQLDVSIERLLAPESPPG